MGAHRNFGRPGRRIIKNSIDGIIRIGLTQQIQLKLMRHAEFAWDASARIAQIRLQRHANLAQPAAGRGVASYRTFREFPNGIRRIQNAGFCPSVPKRRHCHLVVERSYDRSRATRNHERRRVFGFDNAKNRTREFAFGADLLKALFAEPR